MTEKSERWAFARIRELEKECSRLRKRIRVLTVSRDLWKGRAVRKAARR